MTATRARDLVTRQCTRCGGAGTHYLTCPTLRLPPGYRLNEDSGPGRAGPRGAPRVTRRISLILSRYPEGPRGEPGGLP